MQDAAKGLNSGAFAAWAHGQISGWNQQAGASVPAPSDAELNLLFQTYKRAGSMQANTLIDNLGNFRSFGTGTVTGPATAQQLAHYQTLETKAAPKGKVPPPPPGQTTTATGTTAPPGQTPANAAVSTTQLSSVFKPGTDPGLIAAVQSAVANSSSGSVSYWTGLGVDPTAPVLGTTYTKQGPEPVLPGQPGSAGLPQSTTKTAGDWLKGLYQMTPAQLSTVQHQLFAQGWYNGTGITLPSQINFGQPDNFTLQAYGAALAQTSKYNLAGHQIGIDDVINLGSPTAKANSADAANYFFPEYNPANIQTGFQSVSQSLLGHEDSGMTPQMTAAYQQAESNAAHGKDIAKAAAQGQYEQKPTPTDFATQYLINNDPSEVAAYGAASRLLDVQSMLGVK